MGMFILGALLDIIGLVLIINTLGAMTINQLVGGAFLAVLFFVPGCILMSKGWKKIRKR